MLGPDHCAEVCPPDLEYPVLHYHSVPPTDTSCLTVDSEPVRPGVEVVAQGVQRLGHLVGCVPGQELLVPGHKLTAGDPKLGGQALGLTEHIVWEGDGCFHTNSITGALIARNRTGDVSHPPSAWHCRRPDTADYADSREKQPARTWHKVCIDTPKPRPIPAPRSVHEAERHRRPARRAGLRPQQEGEVRLRQAQARGDGRRLRLRRGPDRAPAHRGRGPHRPRVHCLRGIVLGQPRDPLLRAHPLQDRYDHGPHRAGRGHGPQREAAVSRHQTGHRLLQPGGGLRLQHLHPGPDRGRHRGRLQGGDGALGDPGGAGGCRRLLRDQEPRQPYRRGQHGQVRLRGSGAGPGAARYRKGWIQGPRCDPGGGVQHRR